ncbi:MAG: hypothetical protein F6K30_17425, partial [Cyanothece sp. SIO2G6]|nr:hypothetical protein [Cyanothece sp. SIO2G6]
MVEFIVIVESRADAETATKLAERVLVEQVNWLDEEQLQYFFQWSGLEESTSYSCWKNINPISQRFKETLNYRPPRFLGHGTSGPLKADGAAAMKVLNLIRFLQRNRKIEAVLLIRDLDNQPQRRKGLKQARTEHAGKPPSLAIVIGTANRMREAWVLNGFIALTDEEEMLLQDKLGMLQFDPCKESHRLQSPSAGHQDVWRKSKTVLKDLTVDNYFREQQCWEETSLEHLRQTGIYTGLTEYLT